MAVYDSIVAGAGMWGCTVARRLSEAGKKVLVLEKRPVVGGNVRCEIDPETGIEIHTYGSHIFHTHIPEVWKFVNRFVSFNGYQHKVIAHYQGKNYYLPLGLSLINKFFSVELKPGEVEDFMKDETHSEAIFDAFFRGYTSKQWGKAPEDIDPAIIKRVPVRNTYDVNYFNDYWQGIPTEGYNALFEKLLDHPNIEVVCNAELCLSDETSTDSSRAVGCIQPGVGTPNRSKFCVRRQSSAVEESLPDVPVYYSGPVDALFNYKFGPLPWRTLNFELETLNCSDYQGSSVVNYTEASVPYTRVHEFKHYHPEPIGPLSQAESLKSGKKTIIMREYSATWKLGDEPYYPVKNPESATLLAKYQNELAAVNQKLENRNCKLTVGGRLGMCKYFDMDKSIESALKVEV